MVFLLSFSSRNDIALSTPVLLQSRQTGCLVAADYCVGFRGPICQGSQRSHGKHVVRCPLILEVQRDRVQEIPLAIKYRTLWIRDFFGWGLASAVALWGTVLLFYLYAYFWTHFDTARALSVALPTATDLLFPYIFSSSLSPHCIKHTQVNTHTHTHAHVHTHAPQRAGRV